MATAPISDSTSRGTDLSQPASRPTTPGLTDALGQRLVTVDSGSGTQVELLWFKREFSESPSFVEAVRKRIDEIGRVRDRSLGVVRGVKSLAGVEGLVLMSTHVPGRRLADLLSERHDAAFVLDFIKQVAQALATLHRQGAGVAHGLLNANRVVLASDGRFVVIEQTLGPAFASLRLATNRLRSDFGLAVPAGLDPDMFDQRSDVVQLGVLALSLLAGRPIDPSDYPARTGAIVDECFRSGTSAPAALRGWLERALQIGDRPFASTIEAQASLEQEIAPPAAGATTAATVPPPPAVTVVPPAPATASAIGASSSDHPSELISEAETSAPHITPLFADAPAIPESRRRFGRVPVLAGLGILILGGGAALVVPHLLAKPAGAESSALPSVTNTPLFTSPSGSDNAAPSQASSNTIRNTVAPEPAPASFAPPAPPPVVEKAAAPAAAKAAAASASDSEPAGAAGQDRFGAIRFSSPVELQVIENGAVVGSTVGSVAVTDGAHTFDVVNDLLGFRTRQTVTVKAGRMTAVTIAVPNGQISINAVPWADVLIDGKSVGQTPIANFSVPIGAHEIVFRHPQFGERTQTAVVKVSGLTRVSATFQN
jgi:PEGA domain